MSDTMQSLDQLSQFKPATPEAPKYVKKVDKYGRAYATGKRKDAVARVWIKPGAGKVTVNTRDPIEHDAPFDTQANEAIARLQRIGVEVLFTGGHHRKLAILDRKVLWEGSLNILSQNDSCEIMRRIGSRQLAEQMVQFTGISRFL